MWKKANTEHTHEREGKWKSSFNAISRGEEGTGGSDPTVDEKKKERVREEER